MKWNEPERQDGAANDDHDRRLRDAGPAMERRSMLKLAGAAAAAATLGTVPAAAQEDANSVVQETDLGGGPGYEDTVPPSVADYTAANASELESALSAAGSGDVVYLTGDAQVDSELTVPSGVTLASDRGIDGSDGARLHTGQKPWSMLRVHGDARITGLRIDGPQWDWIEYQDSSALAVDVVGTGVEIDNVEAYGWGYAAIRTADDTHIHHNHIHHNPEDGLGYGVSTVNSTNPIIEYNVFDHNRHSVAASGGGGYVARYNFVGKGAISHVFDQHQPGGTTTEIHHNTVTVVEHDWKDKNAPAVAIRGVPDDVADIHHNWFYNPKPPRDTPNDWTDEAIIQVHTDSWQNVSYHDNHYGSDQPDDPDVGAPMDGGGGGGGSDGELLLVPQGEIVNYTMVVDGSVEFVEEGDHNAGDADSKTQNPDGTVTVEGATGEGSAAGGDTYVVNGEILSFEADGPLDASLDGESVAVDDLATGREKLQLVPQGEIANYTLTVDGSVEFVEEGDHDAGDADSKTQNGDGTVTVEGATGSGSAAGGDTFLLDGETLAFDADAALTIYRNGESIDVSAVPSGRDKFTIIPTGTVTNYTLTVDGTVDAVEEGDHNAGDADEVTVENGTTTVDGATGSSPTAGGDMWMVEGTITDLSTDADADCWVNGDSVSPGSF